MDEQDAVTDQAPGSDTTKRRPGGRLRGRRGGCCGSERNGSDGASNISETCGRDRAAFGAVAIGAFAVGALSIGALAIGAVAIGRLRIGRADLGEVRIKLLQIEQLHLADDEVLTGC